MLATDSASIPPSFYCPITHEIMKEPTMLVGNCQVGHTFEKEAIESWVKANHTCPVCRVPVELKDLRRNLPLKKAIEEVFK